MNWSGKLSFGFLFGFMPALAVWFLWRQQQFEALFAFPIFGAAIWLKEREGLLAIGGAFLAAVVAAHIGLLVTLAIPFVAYYACWLWKELRQYTSEAKSFVLLNLMLFGLMAWFFRAALFDQDRTLFSNDGPLGVISADYASPANSLSGQWQDLNWLGFAGPAYDDPVVLLLRLCPLLAILLIPGLFALSLTWKRDDH